MKIGLTISGMVLFVVSFFLPAYYNIPGYECAQIVLTDIWGDESDQRNRFLVSVYYLAFNFSNGLMLALPVLLLIRFRAKPVPLWMVGIQFVLLLHVLSWPVIHLVESVEEFQEIKVGYYLWLLSMCLILVASVLSRRQN